jgi:hypothetical protein
MWCIPKVDSHFVAKMEAVLDCYEQAYNPKEPVVCFDETSKQLIAETRTPLPMTPGQPLRYDYEYERCGTRNLFLFFEPLANWRQITVTQQRTRFDFAHQMQRLVDEFYPHADCIHLVLDNLNTHTAAALYDTFAPHEARRILRRIRFHYTPKHASWLNMAEIEFSVFSRTCLNQRIPDEATLTRQVKALEAERNCRQATVDWQFTCEDARIKLKRLYPSYSA